jgi:hypothetical protein
MQRAQPRHGLRARDFGGHEVQDLRGRGLVIAPAAAAAAVVGPAAAAAAGAGAVAVSGGAIV